MNIGDEVFCLINSEIKKGVITAMETNYTIKSADGFSRFPKQVFKTKEELIKSLREQAA